MRPRERLFTHSRREKAHSKAYEDETARIRGGGVRSTHTMAAKWKVLPPTGPATATATPPHVAPSGARESAEKAARVRKRPFPICGEKSRQMREHVAQTVRNACGTATAYRGRRRRKDTLKAATNGEGERSKPQTWPTTCGAAPQERTAPRAYALPAGSGQPTTYRRGHMGR